MPERSVSDESPYDALIPLGWSDRWAALLGELGEDAEPARVLRHDGVAVQVGTPTGERMVKLRRGIEALTVGDWLAIEGESVVGLLERASLLRRRAAGGDDHQLLAANLDLVLLVCGLDRPVTAGRIQRGEALAWDAGAHPVLVLTKADLASAHASGDDPDDPDRLDRILATVDEQHPGLERMVVSSVTGLGIDELRRRLAGHTSVLLGESGAGKSRLVNAVLGSDAAVVGAVREGDRKGRHTTTNRQLHQLPTGGVLIDSPGIREVGLAGDEESVDATFADIDELGEECYFADCGHAGEPGCAIALALEAGELSADRLEAYQALRKEAASAARRSDEHERRTYERGFTKAVKAHVQQKPSNRQ